MKEDNKELLEQILATEVLILSKLMEHKKLSGGTKRVGADYTRDAVREIKLHHPKIMSLLQEQ